MAEQSSKPPVTDSRFAGFNPEVEESKATAEKAAAAKAAGESGAATAKPQGPRKPFEIIRAYLGAVALLNGNHPELRALLDELDKAVG